MSHDWAEDDQHFHTSYGLNKNAWHQVKVVTEKNPISIQKDTSEHFFSKHYWGTSQIDSGSCTVYEIEHPEWSIYKTIDADISFDFGLVFGSEFAVLNSSKPESVQLFNGSPVKVYKRSILR
ncbi:MAG: hypothetical protein Crog4KO_22930 [Crocinitomicaceae bacterium]